jgi:cytidylate kinase
MGAQIVTIAMTAGTHAVEVGRQVAERLGFRYVNDEIIDRAAAQAGVSRETMAEVERSPSLLSRIVTAIASGVLGQSAVHISPEDIDASPSYQRLIQDVIRETAAKGRVVILAHGAGMLLAGTPGVLRVLVTASPATRIRRLAAESGRDERWAAREIERSEGERRSFFKRFHDLDEELPTHYDLVVNTDVLSAEEAARVIACAAGASPA